MPKFRFCPSHLVGRWGDYQATGHEICPTANSHVLHLLPMPGLHWPPFSLSNPFFFQGLDLRTEHFHCFSAHGEGGHYHYDVTPDDVHYTGFFSLAERVYRIDRPLTTHNVGRDWSRAFVRQLQTVLLSFHRKWGLSGVFKLLSRFSWWNLAPNEK